MSIFCGAGAGEGGACQTQGFIILGKPHPHPWVFALEREVVGMSESQEEHLGRGREVLSFI